MKQALPRIYRQETPYGQSAVYLPEGPEVNLETLRVEARESLMDVHNAITFGEQRRAFVGFVLSSAVRARHVHEVRPGKLQFTTANVDMRFRLENVKDEQDLKIMNLIFLRVGRATVEYPTPQQYRCDPAFAVVNIGGYHHVARDPGDILETVGTDISENFVKRGSEYLDHKLDLSWDNERL